MEPDTEEIYASHRDRHTDMETHTHTHTHAHMSQVAVPVSLCRRARPLC